MDGAGAVRVRLMSLPPHIARRNQNGNSVKRLAPAGRDTRNDNGCSPFHRSSRNLSSLGSRHADRVGIVHSGRAEQSQNLPVRDVT